MEYYLDPNMVKKGPLRWDEIFLLYSRTALWFANSTADPLAAASLAIMSKYYKKIQHTIN